MQPDGLVQVSQVSIRLHYFMVESVYLLFKFRGSMNNGVEKFRCKQNSDSCGLTFL